LFCKWFFWDRMWLVKDNQGDCTNWLLRSHWRKYLCLVCYVQCLAIVAELSDWLVVASSLWLSKCTCTCYYYYIYKWIYLLCYGRYQSRRSGNFLCFRGVFYPTCVVVTISLSMLLFVSFRFIFIHDQSC
jgi:hypothetical protein